MACKFEKPLLWLDCEMTGLDPLTDKILEVACILTDGELKHIQEGPSLVLHCPKSVLDMMGEWCSNQHRSSGLTKACLQSTLTVRDAEKSIIDFLKANNVEEQTAVLAGNSIHVDKEYVRDAEKSIIDFLKANNVEEQTAVLAGNSIHMDKEFLRREMPELLKFLHYRILDVSSIKIIAERWFPSLAVPKKSYNHRALDDIKESIQELKYYRQNIFQSTAEYAAQPVVQLEETRTNNMDTKDDEQQRI
ncbi:oligoribonuclease, putative [Eimeria praecox]|uniref:Oligoribonuclease, putative n=1 Tax=Eimeria praecox TaxID=51316 RepID=U6G4Z9_9EIME|nr:oligoribonuclease, putative [Eimeria praecox]